MLKFVGRYLALLVVVFVAVRIVQPPFADCRSSWLIFSRVDGLHLERTDADADCPLDRASPQPENLPRSGAAHLLVSHDRLHLRDVDSVLPKLTCINPPHLRTNKTP